MKNPRALWIVGGLIVVAIVAGSIPLWRAHTNSPVVSDSPDNTPLSDNTVQLDSPLSGERISSPLIIRGKARGGWFFEASFPITLTDWDGKIIAEGQAHATRDWMTTDWVPFEATLTFTKPSYGERGFLILKKDNPSGLPQNDDSREITIFFK